MAAPTESKSATGSGDGSSSITDWVKRGDKTGEFKRVQSQFRNWISSAPGAEFPPEKGRYHLYVSYACPWAHRTLIVRRLKHLEDTISFTSVHWELLEGGWRFVRADEAASSSTVGGGAENENVTPDPLHDDFSHLSAIYRESDAAYAGRFTVPVLYDKKTRRIVSNESADIIRMLNREFGAVAGSGSGPGAVLDLVPASLEAEIDRVNAWTYDAINNGVYKAGFATTQEAYDVAVTALFAGLDRAEAELAAGPGPFFFGAELTETDVRLYTTLIRFDCLYVQHFKCNIRDIRSGYPALHRWLRTLYWTVPGFRETTNFEHIKKHYTKSHRQINPFSITPAGPLPEILPLDSEAK